MNAVVTGASSGIGFELARGLVLAGFRVWTVSRGSGNGDLAAARLNEEAAGRGEVTFLPADLASLSEVRRVAGELAARVGHLDLLLNNAGAYVHRRILTEDGFERNFALNHLSPFLLTHLLLEPLMQAEAPRVITTSSNAERMGALDLERAASGVPFSAWRAYAMSKQANIHFARELAWRRPHPLLRSHAFHPGFVASRFGADAGWLGPFIGLAQRLFGRSSVEGADTGLYLATTPDPPEPNGAYLLDRKVVAPSGGGRDEATGRALWERSEQWVGLGSAVRLRTRY